MSSSRLVDALQARDMRLVDLARAIGVHKATTTRWARHRVPAERLLEIEKITGISRHELRPDLYPEEAVTA